MFHRQPDAKNERHETMSAATHSGRCIRRRCERGDITVCIFVFVCVHMLMECQNGCRVHTAKNRNKFISLQSVLHTNPDSHTTGKTRKGTAAGRKRHRQRRGRIFWQIPGTDTQTCPGPTWVRSPRHNWHRQPRRSGQIAPAGRDTRPHHTHA